MKKNEVPKLNSYALAKIKGTDGKIRKRKIRTKVEVDLNIPMVRYIYEKPITIKGDEEVTIEHFTVVIK